MYKYENINMYKYTKTYKYGNMHKIYDMDIFTKLKTQNHRNAINLKTNPRQRRHFVEAVERQATKDLEIFIRELSCPQRLVRRTAVRLSRVLSFMIGCGKVNAGKVNKSR